MSRFCQVVVKVLPTRIMATIIRHPIELLQTFEDNFRCLSPKVLPKMTKRKIQDIKSEFDDSLERMEFLYKSAIAAHNITSNEEKNKLDMLFKKTRKRLCMSLISAEFEQKYERELRQVTGSREFFALLSEIFGTLTEKEKVRKAKEDLQEITRNADEEETFTRFLTKVTILAKEASKNCNILCKHYEEDAFDKCLTPELRRYLLDQGMNDKDAKTTAEYLDKMKKHRKKATVRAVSAQEIILQEQVNALTIQITNLPALIKESLGTSMMSEKIERLERELAYVNKIGGRGDQRNQPEERRSAPRLQEQSQTRQPAEQRHNDYRQQEIKPREGSYPSNFEIGPSGYPYRCHTCGVLGHRSFNCRGTSLICRICNRRGHIQAACPTKMSKN